MKVLSVDERANALTVETSTGHNASFGPASLKRQMVLSMVYREEERELASGDRIQFIASDRPTDVRNGTLGTIEQIAENNAVSVRLDNRKLAELTPNTPTTSTTDMQWSPRAASFG